MKTEWNTHLYFLLSIIFTLSIVKAIVLLFFYNECIIIQGIEHIFTILFIPFFLFFIWKRFKERNYSKELNKVLISQSQNALFYQGDVKEGAKLLTKKVADALKADRCSIWLYNKNKSAIICQQLYIEAENEWYSDMELMRRDAIEYFNNLEITPIIVANNAETHLATSCLKNKYLIPLGVKSMLDIPIIYKGSVIGVLCIESKTFRKWKSTEITFSQILSSLYSFAHTVRENTKLSKELFEFDKFVNASVLVSKTDKKGKITYVNKKFQEVSGYTSKESVGKTHNIVNSGEHDNSFWNDMYNTTIKKKKIWNKIITNRNKNGELYWVDSYIKAEFEDNNLIGFTSIRYDVTDLIKSLQNTEKKNTYLEHAAKIIRHDLHSGINTYIPRGVNSLERRLSVEQMEELKILAPFKMIKEGLAHTQKVYTGVYQFTNLVKKDSHLEVTFCDLKEILNDFLNSTSYKSQVKISPLIQTEVNQSLFCTALDNLIRNGLRYNDSNKKMVWIQMEGDILTIQDNGRGLTQEDFNNLSKPYTRDRSQKETGTGLGLNICVAILKEHGFNITCEKNDIGTKMKIQIK
jgi:PAS domain S-box-containing protein